MFSNRRNLFLRAAAAAVLLGPCAAGGRGADLQYATNPVTYSDNRPTPAYRLDAQDQGKFFDYGQGPNSCDVNGAREALINVYNGTYYLYYDGCGSDGWRACLAESTDLQTWTREGAMLPLGASGKPDSASASAPWFFSDGATWHMYYLGTPNSTGSPNYVPQFPYQTLQATGPSLAGPWTKNYGTVPFNAVAGTYYSITASPGQVEQQGSQYMMFFSAATKSGSATMRTIGIARTTNLSGTWTVDASPIVPNTEQVENSSMYYQASDQTWFLFTNHIGISGSEYTDGIWVYWTKDLNHWDTANKAVVLDGTNCTWSQACIGMPSVVQVGNQLDIFYDAPGGTSTSHMQRSLGRATLSLPLSLAAPAQPPFVAVSRSFEEAKNLSGWTPKAGASVASVPGPWALLSGSGGCLWPTATQFKSGSATDGDICLYLTSGGVLAQTLAGTLQPNTTYTVQIDVGRRSDLSWTGYKIELWAGGTRVAFDADAAEGGTDGDPAAGDWKTITASYKSGASVSAGQQLQIRLYGYGSQTVYDNVVSSAVPEPGSLATAAVAALALAGACGLRKWRKKTTITFSL